MNLFELYAKISVDDTDFKKSMENVQRESKNVANAMKELQSPLDKAKNTFNAISHPIETAKSGFQKLKDATESLRHPIETLKDKVNDAGTALETKRNKLSVLASGYDSAKKKVEDLTKEFNKSAKESGTTSKETQELAKKLNEAEKEAEQAKKELDDYSSSVSKTSKISETATKAVGNFAGALGKGLGKGLVTTAKVGVAAVGAAAAGIVALTKSAVENYAEYEQLVGGVETLFTDSRTSAEAFADSISGSSDAIKEFQKANNLAVDGILGPKTMAAIEAKYGQMQEMSTKAVDMVKENAANAYKTAGLSANEYMETVTSFSASLLQSLGGDTEAAAEYADRAVTDMSDNANKMGTSMEMIQNAYQGFAKQNYTIKFIYSPAA